VRAEIEAAFADAEGEVQAQGQRQEWEKRMEGVEEWLSVEHGVAFVVRAEAGDARFGEGHITGIEEDEAWGR
jgi:hypothetical protein